MKGISKRWKLVENRSRTIYYKKRILLRIFATKYKTDFQPKTDSIVIVIARMPDYFYIDLILTVKKSRKI